MPALDSVQNLLDQYRTVTSIEELAEALSETCARLDCRHYAVTQHIDFARASDGLRLHNYPDEWARTFDRQGLGLTDPIHRASHRSLTGFRWQDVEQIITLTDQDRRVLAKAREHGLAEGYTVPAHVPGEVLGSCSFVKAPGGRFETGQLPVAHLAGQFAFEAARRLQRRKSTVESAELTPRQLECVMYVGRGKTDGEIATILGVSQATVIEHLKHARGRYNASARAALPVRALFDGALSFSDLLRR
jgi:LuxR family transcriptional regulator, quorum-sensing system regulator CciR